MAILAALKVREQAVEAPAGAALALPRIIVLCDEQSRARQSCATTRCRTARAPRLPRTHSIALMELQPPRTLPRGQKMTRFAMCGFISVLYCQSCELSCSSRKRAGVAMSKYCAKKRHLSARKVGAPAHVRPHHRRRPRAVAPKQSDPRSGARQAPRQRFHRRQSHLHHPARRVSHLPTFANRAILAQSYASATLASLGLAATRVR